MMWHRTILCETFIRGDQQAFFPLCHGPESIVLHPFIWGAAYVTHVVAHQTEVSHRHQRDMLINEALHASLDRASKGVTCSSASAAA